MKPDDFAIGLTAAAITALFAIVITFLGGVSVWHRAAQGRDNGQWEEMAPQVREWFKNLMQPDNPHVSCCGLADAYWADSFEVDGGAYVAIITDERDDGPLGRPHIPPGTRIQVPNRKLKYDQGNPTGHGIIFVNTTLDVLCYIVPGGV